MVSPGTLEKHITHKIEQGMPKKDVLKQLTSAGWPEDIVKQYLSKTEAESVQLSFLKMEGITKAFGNTLVLERTDFIVHPGEIIGILGESNSGKSTLLHILVGFIEPDAGDVILTLQNQPPVSVIKHPETVKKLIGFATQTPAFYGKLTVLENLNYFGALYGLSGVELIEQTNSVADFTGLSDFINMPAQALPHEPQKRLNIACSIIHNPKILVIDEPTQDLDTGSAQRILKLIKRISEQGTTIIFASHDFEYAEQLCTRIAVLRDKKIVETGTLEELKNVYAPNYQIILETARKNYQKIISLLKTCKIKNTTITTINNKLVITTQTPEPFISRLPSITQKCKDQIKSFNVNKPTLRDLSEMLLQKSAKKDKK